ncbi:hypothetical protein HDU86_005430 [Geranomyces michiganensis]|nr:hypothetical protein HDU86_005430 [Geranomyces michiganensis]
MSGAAHLLSSGESCIGISTGPSAAASFIRAVLAPEVEPREGGSSPLVTAREDNIIEGGIRRRSVLDLLRDVVYTGGKESNRPVVSWMTGKFIDDELEKQYNTQAYPMWQRSNIAVLAADYAHAAMDPTYVDWTGSLLAVHATYGSLVVLPALSLIILIYQSLGNRAILPPKVCSIGLLTTMCIYYFMAYGVPDILAVQFGSPELDEIIVRTRTTLPLEISVVWMGIFGVQTEFRYKAVAVLIYLFGLRLLIRSLFCKELLISGDFGATSQLVLVASGLVNVLKRERMQKQSWEALHTGRVEPHSVDSLHDVRPVASSITRFGIRRRVVIGVKEYWKFFQNQTFRDAHREKVFRLYFSHAVINGTRLQYAVACLSSLASMAVLLFEYKGSVNAAAITSLGIVLPAMCVLGFAVTFVPFVGPTYPHRQQLTTLIFYTIIQSYAIAATANIVPDIPPDAKPGQALDIYISLIAFRFNLITTRAGSATLRGHYRLASIVIDVASTMYAFSHMRRTVAGTVIASVFAPLTLCAAMVILPWGEKAHRRYCRTVIWESRSSATRPPARRQSSGPMTADEVVRRPTFALKAEDDVRRSAFLHTAEDDV